MGLLIITWTLGNLGQSDDREEIGLTQLLIFLYVASKGFALLSIFSNLQDEKFLPTKLVFISESPTVALDSDKMDLFSPASRLLSLPFPLSDMPFPTLSSS